ncbi:GNAT family N-acetyltransferase [Lentibacillus salicampi]|uniref:N-acetyltransferase n=1 Tax=Lentibacillus salicampi TaxID=175306 RepID=A0A4Y9A996_9BACI|nr:GNAT family N-acetyltransferase [Lentibacillus salicampi]TFJ92035.1 N-acetyltransferase [Lentibacillus salicampi]
MECVHFETGFPEQQLMAQILRLHEEIFEDSATLIEKAKHKHKILFSVGIEKEEVVGYKIGYEMKPDIFYSWLGGVNKIHRHQGIASKLMNEQHSHLKSKGYKTVQTKTKNKWRNMLILNIRCGFNVVGIETDQQCEPKIILEKKL